MSKPVSRGGPERGRRRTSPCTSASKSGNKDILLPEWIEFGCRRLDQFGLDEDQYGRETLRPDPQVARVGLLGDRPLPTTPKPCGSLAPGKPGKYIEQTICSSWACTRRPIDGRGEGSAELRNGLRDARARAEKEIDEVGLPRNRDVAWKSSQRTLGLISKEDCRLERLPLEPEALSALWFYVRHPRSRILGAPRRSPKSRRQRRGSKVYTDVLSEIGGRPPRGQRSDGARDWHKSSSPGSIRIQCSWRASSPGGS